MRAAHLPSPTVHGARHDNHETSRRGPILAHTNKALRGASCRGSTKPWLSGLPHSSAVVLQSRNCTIRAQFHAVFGLCSRLLSDAEIIGGGERHKRRRRRRRRPTSARLGDKLHQCTHRKAPTTRATLYAFTNLSRRQSHTDTS